MYGVAAIHAVIADVRAFVGGIGCGPDWAA
jgi:hypothetical protein